MANQNPLSQAQLDLLLKMAGKQLHIDPKALKQQLERGDLSSINQLNSLLSDPQKMQQVLSQTNLQQLLQNLK